MIRLLRSSAFRIALAFAGGLVVLTYLVFAILDWQLYRENIALTRSVLEDEAAKALADSSRQLEDRLKLRLTEDLRHLDIVGLYDTDGRLVFGNAAATLAVPADGRAHVLRIPPLPGTSALTQRSEPWQSETTVLVARPRRDGCILLLGRSLVYVDQLRAAALRVFAETLGPVTAAALAVGVAVSVRASRRLQRLKEAITQVMAGELDRRLPVRGSPDDLDELCREVNRMLDEIGRLVGQIRAVGDNIAHDLRAPLAVMRARLERGIAGDDEALLRALAAAALTDLDGAMTAVTALLRISQLESGVRRGAFAAIDLAGICRDAFDLLEPLAEVKGVAMRLEGGDATLLGDADLLREAVVNLVDNAVKFTPAGGAVTIGCGHPDFLVRVGDTGPGIAAEERVKVVRRFYRSTKTAAAGGVGLGLSMANTIIELHGCHLEIADARPGSASPGALFTIRRGSADPRMNPSPASPSFASLSPARTLD